MVATAVEGQAVTAKKAADYPFAMPNGKATAVLGVNNR
jgi:hypothetical protein